MVTGYLGSLAVTDLAKKPGWLIAAAVIAFFFVFNFGFTPANPSDQWLLTGVYLLGIAVLFVCAYFFENESYVFRGLIWVCEHFSSPRSRKMALFYAAFGAVIGTVAILQGLGVINVARHG